MKSKWEMGIQNAGKEFGSNGVLLCGFSYLRWVSGSLGAYRLDCDV